MDWIGWLIPLGFVVWIGGLIALLPWARRFDQKRALERGERRHPWVSRALWIAVVAVLLAVGIYLSFFAS